GEGDRDVTTLLLQVDAPHEVAPHGVPEDQLAFAEGGQEGTRGVVGDGPEGTDEVLAGCPLPSVERLNPATPPHVADPDRAVAAGHRQAGPVGGKGQAVEVQKRPLAEGDREATYLLLAAQRAEADGRQVVRAGDQLAVWRKAGRVDVGSRLELRQGPGGRPAVDRDLAPAVREREQVAAQARERAGVRHREGRDGGGLAAVPDQDAVVASRGEQIAAGEGRRRGDEAVVAGQRQVGLAGRGVQKADRPAGPAGQELAV